MGSYIPDYILNRCLFLKSLVVAWQPNREEIFVIKMRKRYHRSHLTLSEKEKEWIFKSVQCFQVRFRIVITQ